MAETVDDVLVEWWAYARKSGAASQTERLYRIERALARERASRTVDTEAIRRVAEEMDRQRRSGGVLAAGQAGQLTSDLSQVWAAVLRRAIGQ